MTGQKPEEAGRSGGPPDIPWWMRAARRVRRLVPTAVKLQIWQRVPDRFVHRHWRAQDPYADSEEASTYPARVDVRLGIVKEVAHLHRYYITACREMGVPYRLVDISGPDWADVVRDCDCDGFLVRPSVYRTVWKQLYDERLRVMVEEMGKTIYPSLGALWIYESKRRMSYWLQANGIPHPKTWVFYRREPALGFAEKARLPLVFKADLGSGGIGVKIVRTRSDLRRIIRRCFGRGFQAVQHDRRDRQWGSILLQEYIADAREWRMIRIGESFFGYEKLRVGDFHSGSHKWDYSRPPDELLDLLKDVTDTGGFSSMDLDVLITSDGSMLVSELQTLFGMGNPYEMCVVDGKPGRMLHDRDTGRWRFQAGRFCGNRMCNLRVEALLRMLGKEPADPPGRVGAFEGVDMVEAY